MARLLMPGLVGVATLSVAGAGYLGLVWAPRESFMGDVYRIMYVHVPSAWMALLAYTLNLGVSVAYLWRPRPKLDAVAEASAAVGVVFNALTLVTGSIWGKPTWGVWWVFDPRLVSAAVMFFTYGGYLSLRRFADDADKRARWSAVVGVIAYVNIVIVWYSVKWWNTLHQLQSSPATMSSPMTTALRVSALAFLVVLVLLVLLRTRLALQRRADEVGVLEEP